jgi:hypothetical protein
MLRIGNSAADWRCTSGSPACCGSWRLEAGDDVLHLGLDLLGVIGVELHGPEVGEELSWLRRVAGKAPLPTSRSVVRKTKCSCPSGTSRRYGSRGLSLWPLEALDEQIKALR